MAPSRELSFFRRALMAFGLAKVRASLLVVGLANSGKTSIVRALQAGKATEDTAPTVGFAVEKFCCMNTALTVMDMSGQRRYHKLWECYFQDVQGVILVVDAADQAQLPEAAEVLQHLQRHAELQATPLLVYANKMDLAHAVPSPEVASRLRLPEMTDKPWQIAASSAMTGEGVEEGLAWLLGQLAPQPLRRSKSSRLRKCDKQHSTPGADA